MHATISPNSNLKTEGELDTTKYWNHPLRSLFPTGGTIFPMRQTIMMTLPAPKIARGTQVHPTIIQETTSSQNTQKETGNSRAEWRVSLTIGEINRSRESKIWSEEWSNCRIKYYRWWKASTTPTRDKIMILHGRRAWSKRLWGWRLRLTA